MRVLRACLFFFFVFVLSSCATQTPPMAPTQSDLGPNGSASGSVVVDQNVSATYAWHAGDAFLAALNPAFSPDVAQAPNGDRIRIIGTGTLRLHPKSATGGGTFAHLSPSGTVLVTGTFTVVELISFVSYGPGPATPPSFNSGKALLRVLLFPGGAGSGIEGTLRIECALPGSEFPNGMHEGINLNVPGIANFNQQVSGATVFVRTS